MCETCGCDADGSVVSHVANGEPMHVHVHVHADGQVVQHSHEHDPVKGPRIRESVQVQVLARNQALAARNRLLLQEQRVFAVNLMSSPGAGKTTLLSRTLPELSRNGPVGVIEGDQATALDADRIAQTGVPVVQINTGKGCHLDADMIFAAMQQLSPAPSSLLIIENVGNLVCPALFDLGEGKRIVLLSVTEGDDKPEKYPNMFAAANLVVLTKIDLLAHVDFDVARARRGVLQLNPQAEWLEVSAKTGAGLPAWLAWLESQRATSLSTAARLAL